jgi:hypothetical protein
MRNDGGLTIRSPAAPTQGSGVTRTLPDIAADLAHRLTRIFLRNDTNGGARPVFGGHAHMQTHPHWRDYVPFHEFFHAETGAGLGASHQTGWTALVALLLQRRRPLFRLHDIAPCSG